MIHVDPRTKLQYLCQNVQLVTQDYPNVTFVTNVTHVVTRVGISAGKKYFMPVAGFNRFKPAKSGRKWQKV